MQTEKKKITNVENCEKTPTIKQFAYYFYTITKWPRRKKKEEKNKRVLLPLFLVIIIHETGTRAATGFVGSEGSQGRNNVPGLGQGEGADTVGN